MAGAQVSLIRGVIVSAEIAREIAGAVEEGFGGFENERALLYEAPIDLGNDYAGSGETAVVVGAPVGPGFGHDYGILRVDGGGTFTLMDRYEGCPKKDGPYYCALTDEEIITLLNKHLPPAHACRVEQLATYVVCFYG